MFTKAARLVKARPTAPGSTAKKGGATKPAGAVRKSAAKKGTAGKATGPGKAPGKAAAKASTKPSTKPTAKPGGVERRPLPLPLRLLAMTCAFVAMVAFAVVLAQLTLDPSPASVSIAHTNLHPGATLRIYLDQPAFRDAVKQIGGNVLLGVPFGILVPVLAPGARGVLRVLLLTAIVMLLVEMAQGALVAGRAFDVDDVILNTTGALVGWLLLGRRLGRAVHARKRKV
ncbi:VanZ family protein [Streptomyces sp. NPDC047061]|uniref:VanZ family protein n=1 Tax=Streptomyces sp. NPDC047061 TaxID=3154605 RepID=UPI003404C382